MFAHVARVVAAERVGAVTGVVGAAGGLGGFFPPLVMGLVYGASGGYDMGFVLLALTAQPRRCSPRPSSRTARCRSTRDRSRQEMT